MTFSAVVSLIALVVSITGTLIIPLWNQRKKDKQLKNEIKKFQQMIETEYVSDLNQEIDNLIQGSSNFSQQKFNSKFIDNNLKRLQYMLVNELIFVTSENQFKLIRMVEFTKMYYKNVDNIVKLYGIPEESNKADTLKIKALVKIKILYKDKLEKYANLETDVLISNNELVEIQNEIRNA